jgi:hypothetical protein
LAKGAKESFARRSATKLHGLGKSALRKIKRPKITRKRLPRIRMPRVRAPKRAPIAISRQRSIAAKEIQLRTENGTFKGHLGEARTERGTDSAGSYLAELYDVQIGIGGRRVKGPAPKASLEVRHYQDSGVTVTFLHYDGPALDSKRAVDLELDLEGFERGMGHSRVMSRWTKPSFVTDPKKLPAQNQMLLWQAKGSQEFHLMMPLVGDGMVAEVGARGRKFRISSASLSEGHSPNKIPLFAYKDAADPYELGPETAKAAFAATGMWGKLRSEKPNDPVFDRLGAGTWNTYYQDITHENVVDWAKDMKAKGVPIGNILIDDGLLTLNEKNFLGKTVGRWLPLTHGKLSGFGADPNRFPMGTKALTDELREITGADHIGLWHTLQGQWRGTSPKTLGKQFKLLPVKLRGDNFIGRLLNRRANKGKTLPDPREAAEESVFGAWYQTLANDGIDFVKVDNQAEVMNSTVPLATTGRGLQKQVQQSAMRHLSSSADSGGVLACMSMTLESFYNLRHANVARNSRDYQADDFIGKVGGHFSSHLKSSKNHVRENAYNAFLTGIFATPDYDVFQTHDPHAKLHAVSRAMSGGPILFSDRPGKTRPKVLRPLMHKDGTILMLDEPGQVTRDLLLRDPAVEEVPLKIFGRIKRRGAGESIMVGVFNVHNKAESVRGRFRLEDVPGLAERATRGKKPERFVAYQRNSGKTTVLDKERTSMGVKAQGDNPELLSLVPIRKGSAVLGLLNKYLGPSAVKSERRSGNKLNVALRGSGTLGVYIENGSKPSVKIDGRAARPGEVSFKQGILKVKLSGDGEHKVQVGLR